MSNIIKDSRRILASAGGSGGGGGTITSIQGGTNITIDNTNPASPIINSSADDITVVANYAALPAAGTVTGRFYWASAPQGTSWLPGVLGGTYYSAGMYYSNGVAWQFMDVPYQATQAEVNTGTNTDKFVTPATLASATGFLKNNIGITGGTTLIGGTATTDTLKFRTTSGVGTTGSDFIWQNGTNGATEQMRLLNSGALVVGATAIAGPIVNTLFSVQKSVNTGMGFEVINSNAGTGAFAGFVISNGTSHFAMYQAGSGYTTSGQYVQNGSTFEANGVGGLSISATGASAPIRFYTNSIEAGRFTSTGQFGIGTTPATTDAISISGSNATRYSIMLANTNSAGNSSFYFQNNRGSFATYGGLMVSGSASSGAGNIFGLSRNDALFLFGDGASLLNMAIGTLVAKPLVFGTNNAEVARFLSTGELCIGTTTNTNLFDVHLSKSKNSFVTYTAENTSSGAAAFSCYTLINDAAALADIFQYRLYSTGFATAGLIGPRKGHLRCTAANGFLISSDNGSIVMSTGGTTVARMTMTSVGLTTWAGAYHVFAAGTTSLATIQLTSGSPLSVAVAGAVEWDGVNLSITQTSGPTRQVLAYAENGNQLALVNTLKNISGN